MKLRKLIATTLSLALALSLSVPAFAAETDLSQSTTITGSTKAPTIKIVVPTTGAVVLNPYSMTVEVDDAEVTDQIISATQYIENYSDVDIKVTATPTATLGGNAKLNATSIAAATKAITTNSVYLRLEMAAVNANNATVDWTDTTLETATAVVAAKATATEMLTLAAGDGTSTLADAGGVGAYHLTGDIVSAPATAWTAADTVTVNVAFTFAPVAFDTSADETT